ncbi:MAG: hypothetical protein AB2A00_15990 [Myxococcota bacterium]
MDKRVGLVTCLQMPEPDGDREALQAAVARQGVAADWVSWDDPDVDWGTYALLVLRSTWNYHRYHEAFLAWVDRAAATTRLLNPAHVVKWNSHKGYLAELDARGVPVTPTEHLRRGSRIKLVEVCARRGWRDVVIKPAVSAGSFKTMRGGTGNMVEAEAFLVGMLAERDMLVQPYLTSVEEHGERSLIYVDGELTHSIRKTPRFAHEHEKVSGAMPIPTEERQVAEQVMEPLRREVLYARVDLARDERGQPMVMELELIEPSLFLMEYPPALERLADAIVARVR